MAGYRDLCGRCFNEEVARLGGFKFEHVQFESIEMVDGAGEPHRFHFSVRLSGEHAALEAFELKDGAPSGYRFWVIPRAISSPSWRSSSSACAAPFPGNILGATRGLTGSKSPNSGCAAGSTKMAAL